MKEAGFEEMIEVLVCDYRTVPLPDEGKGRYEGYKRRTDFIQRYIFPGGHLPTVSALVGSIEKASKGRLVVEDIKSVSGHYVAALRLWREKFLENWERVILPALREKKASMTDLDMDVFRRKFEYYFSYSEAGFATKTLGDVSITVAREGAVELLDDIAM